MLILENFVKNVYFQHYVHLAILIKLTHRLIKTYVHLAILIKLAHRLIKISHSLIFVCIR